MVVSVDDIVMQNGHMILFGIPAIKDSDNSPFGKIKQGENFDYHGVIMYKIDAFGKFYDIKVAYLDFTRTTDGVTQSLGMAH